MAYLNEYWLRQPIYQGQGVQASASITFKNGIEPATGATIVINGSTFTYGIDWTARPVGVSQAKAFADVVNGSLESNVKKATTQVTFSVFALAVQNVCVLMVKVPGTAGNAFTLTKTDTNNCITVSGATFSGGVAGPAAGSAGAPQQAAVGAAQSPSVDVAFGTAVTHISKASNGQLLSVHATNANVAQRFLQIFNRSTALAGGETPIYSFAIAPGATTQSSAIVLDSTFFTLPGSFFSVGITWGFSTTLATYTAGTAADHAIHLHFV